MRDDGAYDQIAEILEIRVIILSTAQLAISISQFTGIVFAFNH
jgi:hypothetical protein